MFKHESLDIHEILGQNILQKFSSALTSWNKLARYSKYLRFECAFQLIMLKQPNKVKIKQTYSHSSFNCLLSGISLVIIAFNKEVFQCN